MLLLPQLWEQSLNCYYINKQKNGPVDLLGGFGAHVIMKTSASLTGIVCDEERVVGCNEYFFAPHHLNLTEGVASVWLICCESSPGLPRLTICSSTNCCSLRRIACSPGSLLGCWGPAVVFLTLCVRARWAQPLVIWTSNGA